MRPQPTTPTRRRTAITCLPDSFPTSYCIALDLVSIQLDPEIRPSRRRYITVRIGRRWRVDWSLEEICRVARRVGRILQVRAARQAGRQVHIRNEPRIGCSRCEAPPGLRTPQPVERTAIVSAIARPRRDSVPPTPTSPPSVCNSTIVVPMTCSSHRGDQAGRKPGACRGTSSIRITAWVIFIRCRSRSYPSETIAERCWRCRKSTGRLRCSSFHRLIAPGSISRSKTELFQSALLKVLEKMILRMLLSLRAYVFSSSETSSQAVRPGPAELSYVTLPSSSVSPLLTMWSLY